MKNKDELNELRKFGQIGLSKVTEDVKPYTDEELLEVLRKCHTIKEVEYPDGRKEKISALLI